MITMVQLVLCMGWVKVAEAMLNPFGRPRSIALFLDSKTCLGDDDDDFEVNYIIDRNITVEGHNL